MSHPGDPIPDLTHQLRDSLSSMEANKPDSRQLDLGSPVSPLRTRAPAASSSSSSSGSISGARKAAPKPGHSGELLSSDTSPGTGLRNPRHAASRSDPLIYSGGASQTQSSVSSPPPVNVLPTGNICPSGRILKSGMVMSSRSSKSDVLGTGTGNYGHGSIMRGGGTMRCCNLDAGNFVNSNCSPGRGNTGGGRMGSMDPEEVKRAGNEMYKKGLFGEALGLYDRAIALSPGNAAYRSNRAAALMALARVAEAVRECEEAVKLDPSYWRAHQRLGSLFIRLGQVENARRHLCIPGHHPDPAELHKLQLVEKHLNKCTDARKVNDWKNTLQECDATIAAGADYSPQLFMCKAEALLKLHQVKDAESCLANVPKLDPYTASCSQSKFFGMLSEAYTFLVRAQIELALGKFENALSAVEKAAQIDPRNVEVAVLLNNVRLVTKARACGNDLFKSERFTEACSAYGEGLKVDPSNSVLFCNRAACWFKLGQWEMSIDDCNHALHIQPNYTKALLRRAASNSKLERWAAAVKDYEVLRKELPNDKEVAESLFHAQVALKKSRGEEVHNMKFGGEVETITGIEQFREAISLPGVSVVYFKTSSNMQCKQISPYLDTLSSRYPSLNFLKVDIEDSQSVASAENVRIVPTFKIYKNGSRVKEMACPSRETLEHWVRHYTL